MALIGTRITTAQLIPTFKELFMRKVAEAATLPEWPLISDEDESDDDESSGSADGGSNHEGAPAIPQGNGGDKISFKHFLSQLVQYSGIYRDVVLGTTKDQPINHRLRHLRMIKAVQTYGFLMHLRAGDCPNNVFREVLRLTESFVLRRHVCRERANDTEGLFARLCKVDPKNPVEAIKEEYRALCPSDVNFANEFATTSFPANLVDRARYCLEQIEAARHGSYNELAVQGPDEVHVEHIMPQKIKTNKAKEEFGDWVSYLGSNAEQLHHKYVDRIGNLTLFAGALNIGASNNPFDKKKHAYKESAILITKDLLGLKSFKFKDIDERSKKLAEQALKLWPMP